MSKFIRKWTYETQEEIQEHADIYLKILMENDKLPHEHNSDVGIAVDRFVNGEVTSKYDPESIERKWAS